MIDKEGLSNCAYLSIGGHGIKQIGVFHIKFLWLAKLIETVLLIVKHCSQTCSLKEMAHAEHCLSRCFYLLTEVGEIEGEGYKLGENDKKLWGAVAWPVRDIIEDSLRVQWFTPEFGDRLFKAIWAMPFDKPTEAYSAMVKAFVKLGGLWPRLAEFIEWWGFDNFTPYDYRRYPEDGALESLAEKVFSAYLMSLHREKEYREPPIAFYEGVEKLALHSQEQADKIYMILNFDKQ